jgi:4-hydroxy-2-oxoheptanedioate aldolase
MNTPVLQAFSYDLFDPAVMADPLPYYGVLRDYVGFDVQHGYLDDADVALLLRRLEHVPIATAVRLPSTDPAPIGRVLDAGSDAVIIAMIESADQAAAAVAATRYAPVGVCSFGPLRASLGHDPAALEGRVSVFAMIETA